MQPFRDRDDTTALRVAWAASFVGLLSAAVSLYWALGGAWLLDTIGGSLEAQARAGTVGVRLAVWAAVALKVIAVVLPLLALRRLPRPAWHRIVWVLAWAEAAVLTSYGLVYTALGLLAQAGVVHATTDPRGLAWHAYLWDPWFLVWGLLVAAALLLGRHRRSQPHPSGGAVHPSKPHVRDAR
jgi:glucan phosphoethanolaminetransferase (alkaline phosphatase superfamily)